MYSRTITIGKYGPSNELKTQMGIQSSSIRKLEKDDRFERNQLWRNLQYLIYIN